MFLRYRPHARSRREEGRRMDRCNDLCTQETIGRCLLCDALTERDRFIRLWFKGGVLMDGVRALKSRGLFAFFLSRRTYLLAGFAAVLLLGLIYQCFWVIPNQQVTSVKIAAEKRELTQKDVYELRNSIRQTFVQALGLLGSAALFFGLYYTAKTLRISQETLRTNQEALRVTQEGHIT